MTSLGTVSYFSLVYKKKGFHQKNFELLKNLSFNPYHKLFSGTPYINIFYKKISKAIIVDVINDIFFICG